MRAHKKKKYLKQYHKKYSRGCAYLTYVIFQKKKIKYTKMHFNQRNKEK